MTFLPCARCEHAQGDHASSGTTWPHPLVFGVCLVFGCGCCSYVARPEPQGRGPARSTDPDVQALARSLYEQQYPEEWRDDFDVSFMHRHFVQVAMERIDRARDASS